MARCLPTDNCRRWPFQHSLRIRALRHEAVFTNPFDEDVKNGPHVASAFYVAGNRRPDNAAPKRLAMSMSLISTGTRAETISAKNSLHFVSFASPPRPRRCAMD